MNDLNNECVEKNCLECGEVFIPLYYYQLYCWECKEKIENDGSEL